MVYPPSFWASLFSPTLPLSKSLGAQHTYHIVKGLYCKDHLCCNNQLEEAEGREVEIVHEQFVWFLKLPFILPKFVVIILQKCPTLAEKRLDLLTPSATNVLKM